MAAVLMLATLTACGEDATRAAGGSPRSAASGAISQGTPDAQSRGTRTSDVLGLVFSLDPCTVGDYTELVTPHEPWLQQLVDVCETPDRRRVRVSNESSTFISVRAVGYATLDADLNFSWGGLAEGTKIEYAREMNRRDSQWRVVAPGAEAYATAPYGYRWLLEVRVEPEVALGGYAVGVLASWVESRLSTRGQKFTDRVVGCAEEIGHAWVHAENSSYADLDELLADAALGMWLTCSSLVRDVANDANSPPPEPFGLRSEFKGLRKHAQATFWDDLIRQVRRAIPLLP